MKLIAHLLIGDLHRLRAALAVWTLVVIANTIVEGGKALVGSDAGLREMAGLVASILWVAELLLIFAMVSLVIHEHPAVGSDAFWLTRPIPPRSLVAAKLILLTMVFLIVPAVADAVLLAVYRVPAAIAAGVIAQRASIHLFVSVLLTMAAALTRNLTRYALLCGAVLLSIATIVGMVVAIENARVATGVEAFDREWVDPTSGQVVAAIVLVFSFLVALAIQYATRNRWRSVALVIVGCVLSYVAGETWPVPLLAPVVAAPRWAQSPAALTVQIDADTITTTPAQLFVPGRPRMHSIVGTLRVNGVQPGWSAAAYLRDVSVRMPDGTTLPSVRGYSFAAVALIGSGSFYPPDRIVRELLGANYPGPGQRGRQWDEGSFTKMPDHPQSPLFALQQDVLSRYAPTRADYRARVVVSLTHYAVDAVLPLAPGATHRNGGYGFTIDNVAFANEEISIAAREWRAASVLERRLQPQYTFYLRSSNGREALALSETDQSFAANHFAPYVPFSFFSFNPMARAFHARSVTLLLPPRFVGQWESAPAPATDDSWIQDAELVIIRTTQEGAVERELHIPALPIAKPVEAPRPMPLP